jgi:tetratricopeptide (TPR) repeat protein
MSVGLREQAIERHKSGDLVKAGHLYRAAIATDPGDAVAHNLLGIVLQQQGDFAGALGEIEQALSLKPDYAQGFNNRGIVRQAQGKIAEAMEDYRRAIALKPTFAKAQVNLGSALEREARLGEALACYEAAIALEPDYAEAQWNRALVLLALGRFAEGWSAYEWRWRIPASEADRRDFAVPSWDGRDLTGRTLLIHGEQGLGDNIQFARYASLAAARGARVVFECAPPLARLFGNLAGVDEALPRGAALPEFDAQIPLLSLPRLFGTTLDTVPAHVPYLHPPAAALRRWGDWLKGLPRPHVGLAWRGSGLMARDPRPIPLEAILSIFADSAASLICLQPGSGDELAGFGNRVVNPAADPKLGREAFADLAETAALVAGLDYVISIDTLAAHLAGALGRPVLMLLPFAAAWRWLERRADSPWYPTMRLLRQSWPDDWRSVVNALHRLFDTA